MKKVLFITGFCLIASLLYSQRSSPELLKVTISHQANGECQSVYLEIKNVSNKTILIMDGSDIDNDGISAFRNGRSYLTFDICSTRAGSKKQSQRVYLGKPSKSKNLIRLLPNESYSMQHNLFLCGAFPGIFSCSPLSWSTLNATFHLVYMISGESPDFVETDLHINTIWHVNARPAPAYPASAVLREPAI